MTRHARLELHSHQSQNIHVILEGTIDIALRGNRSQTYGPGDEKVVAPETNYSATAGPEGCTFIEGHQQLSPPGSARGVC